MLESFIYGPIIQVHVEELAPLNRFSLIWEHLFDQFYDVVVADEAASVDGHALAPCDHEVHQSAEQTVKEKVQLVAIKLLLRLEAEEKHDICRSSAIIIIMKKIEN